MYFFLRVNLDVNVCWCSRIWSLYQAWADSETPPSVAVRAERILGDRVALVLAVALRLAVVLLVEAWGNTALNRPAPTFCPAGGKPGTILPRNQCIGTERSAERSGASRVLSGPQPREAPKVSVACPLRDGPTRPNHYTSTFRNTFVHILSFPDGKFMCGQEKPNKRFSDKFTQVIPCEKECA